MRVAFGTDEATPLADDIAGALSAAGHEVVLRVEDEPWPDVGRRVGEAVAAGEADRGVVCCWTGTGVSIAANKVAGRSGRPVHRRRDGPGRPAMERRQRAGPRIAADYAGDRRRDARCVPSAPSPTPTRRRT